MACQGRQLLAGARIEVDTQDGVVSLKGQVASDKESARAMALAGGIEGVQGVDSQIQIEQAK